MTTYPFGFRVAQAVGLSGAAWLSGNIASLSMLVTPALIQSQKEENVAPRILAKQWKLLYDNGKTQNPPIAAAIASALFYLSWSVREGAPLYERASYSRSGLFAAAAALTLGIVPFTIVAMTRTNNALTEKTKSASETSAAEMVDLLRKWSTLNLARGVFPLVGGLCALAASLL